jgi:hypothetical protein
MKKRDIDWKATALRLADHLRNRPKMYTYAWGTKAEDLLSVVREQLVNDEAPKTIKSTVIQHKFGHRRQSTNNRPFKTPIRHQSSPSIDPLHLVEMTERQDDTSDTQDIVINLPSLSRHHQ